MRAQVNPTHAEVRPGAPTTFTVTVTNTTDIIGGHLIRVLGVDPAWVAVQDPQLSLFPGETGTVTVTITLPAGVAAGELRPVIQVRELTPPHAVSLLDLVLVVAGSRSLAMRLDPVTVTAGRAAAFGLIATNRGNTNITGALVGLDAEEKIRFEFDPPQLSMGPGEHVTVTATLRARRRLTGTPAVRPFGVGLRDQDASALAEPDRGATPIVGTFVQRPVLGRGALALAGLLAAITVFALVITYALAGLAGRSVANRNLALQVAAASAQTSNGTASLAGTVRLLTSGAAVPGVTVDVYATTNLATAVASVATGPTGSYRILGLAAGSYQIAFYGAGFAQLWYPAALSAAGATTVSLANGQAVSGLDVRLGGLPASLSGTVVGTNISGATVSLQLPGANPTSPTVATTAVTGTGSGAAAGALVTSVVVGNGGAFQLTDIPSPAVYQLVVSKPGYSTTAENIDLGGGENRKGLQIPLSLGDGLIAGLVSSVNGPVGGASITATYGSTTVQTASLTQGAVGAFTLRNLPTPGTFTVVVSSPGLASQTLTLSLTPAQQLTGIRVTLAGASGSLSGQANQLVAGVSQPAAGVTVTVTNGTLTIQTVTQSTGVVGHWAVSGLPVPDTYTVTFSRPDLQPQTVSLSLDAYGNATTVGSAATSSPTAVDATLNSATAVLEGTASQAGTSGPATPVGEVSITVSSGTASYQVYTASVPSSAIGDYEIDGLLPGTYTVSAAGVGSAPISQIVTLTAGQVATYNPVIAVPASITGLVSASGGQPIPGADVDLYLASQYPTVLYASTRTDSNGRYTFPKLQAPRHYVVQVVYPPGGSPRASQTLTLPASTTKEVDFSNVSTTGSG